MELWELIARESIRDLVARYNSNGDSGRFSQVLELFAPDAVMDLPDGLYEGIDRISSIFTGTQAVVKSMAPDGGRTYFRHSTSTHQIDLVDESHARGRCYYHVMMPHGIDHWGRYIDDYVKIDDRWLFARRKVTMDGHVPGGMGAASIGE
jgi:hypothetical protein